MVNSIKEDPADIKSKKHFGFDQVFGEDATQVQVFDQTTKNLVHNVLEGKNGTVLAYGATGAGKTFTVTGTAQYPGLIYQTVLHLYHEIELHPSKTEISLSYLEVYNETIKDLFNPNSGPLSILDVNSKVIVAGLSELVPKNLDHLMDLLIKGNANRSQAFTCSNAESSRSHAILQINVKRTSSTSITSATLSVIDLAGKFD